jgi:hypothetical protein
LPNVDDLVGVEQGGETLDDAGTLLTAGHAIDEHQERLAIRPAQIRRLQLRVQSQPVSYKLQF